MFNSAPVMYVASSDASRTAKAAHRTTAPGRMCAIITGSGILGSTEVTVAAQGTQGRTSRERDVGSVLYTGLVVMVAFAVWDMVSPANRRCAPGGCELPANDRAIRNRCGVSQ